MPNACAVACICLVTLFSTAATANRDASFYAGIKGGSYDFFLDDEDEIWDVFEHLWGPFAGYRFNDHLAIEAEYLLLEDDNDNDNAYDADIFVVSVVPTLPIGDIWEIYAKIGWAWVDREVRRGGSFTNFEDDGNKALWGLGTAWNIGHLTIGAEFQTEDDGSGGLDLYSLRMSYYF
jgi:hypothetical protein